MTHRHKNMVFLMLFASMHCGSCISLAEKTGQILDGSAFREKQLALYQIQGRNGALFDMEIQEMLNKAGEHSVLISLGDYPSIKLRGSAPDPQGEFYLNTLEYLGGSVSGWNEYTLNLSGSGKLLLGEQEAVISIPLAPEAVQISSAKIDRYDTRITGNEALTSLRNRRERILALTEWMRQKENAPAGMNRSGFEQYWKPILLPEMSSRKKRPQDWKQQGDRFVRAEDIRWNTGYTGRVFPEELRPVRDSGTLLRDWEEALNWIYWEYEWESIVQALARETVLPRIK